MLTGLSFTGKCGKSWFKKIWQATPRYSTEISYAWQSALFGVFARMGELYLWSHSWLSIRAGYSLTQVVIYVWTFHWRDANICKLTLYPSILFCHLLIALDILHTKYLHKAQATSRIY